MDGLDAKRPPTFALIGDPNFDSLVYPQYWGRVVINREQFFRPFDYRHSVSKKNLFETQGLNFLQAFHPVEVYMIDRKFPGIFVYQGEGGATDVFSLREAQAFANALGEGGFAGPQVAKQKYNIAGFQAFAEIFSKYQRFFRGISREGAHDAQPRRKRTGYPKKVFI